MNRGFSLLLIACWPSISAWAVPQQIVAPGGGNLAMDDRDLTAGFVSPDVWNGTLPLPGHWGDEQIVGNQRFARLVRAPILFGAIPVSGEAVYHEGRLSSVAVYYLESGHFFGYQPELKKSEEGKQRLANRERDFKTHYGRLEKALRESLQSLSKTKARLAFDGVSSVLRSSYEDFAYQGLSLQLRCQEKHYLRVDIRRGEEDNGRLVDPAIARMKRRERLNATRANVIEGLDGSQRIKGVPMFSQGGQAYCGISSFLMIARYLGMRLDAPTLASVSGFRYGLGGKKMLEAYAAAADEAGFHLQRDNAFSFDRVRQAIDSGLPVLVWRKFDSKRDRLHRGRGALPEPDELDRASWPGQGEPNHASVITGYHAERRELIFSDSWGEHARDKHMRVEEMKATVYLTFCFRM